jgi:cysteine-S-conjugate beta-lyase
LRKRHSKHRCSFCALPTIPYAGSGRKKELSRIGEICKKHDLLLFSDEIHADIVYPPHRHIPSAAVSCELAGRTVAAFAPSKTFNLAGLQLSVNVIPDEQLRNEFKHGLSRLHLNMSNIFGIVGTQAAYSRGGEWLDQLIPYLWGNYLATRDYIRQEMPLLSVIEPEGTFLSMDGLQKARSERRGTIRTFR